MQPFIGINNSILSSERFDFTYRGKTKRQIRRQALIQLPLVLLGCSLLFLSLFLLPYGFIMLWIQAEEILFPQRLINKSNRDFARWHGREEFIKHFWKLSPKQREKYRVK